MTTQITLTEMQTIELDIMNSIHIFCREHNLRYSLAYGTLLGAVRHRGFIPWDDDMDIMMPRPDYEKFINTFTSQRYHVVSLKDEGYVYPYAKVYDKRTYLHEQLRYRYPDMGVFIDIFPVDGLPDSYSLRKRQYTQQVILYKLHMSMKYYFSSEWSLLKNIQLAFGRMVEFILPVRKVLGFLERRSLRYSFDNTNEVAILLGDDVLIPIQKEEFNQPVLLQFNGSEFFSIPTYERYLQKLFGDFMKLPPEDKQKSEHRYSVGWK